MEAYFTVGASAGNQTRGFRLQVRRVNHYTTNAIARGVTPCSSAHHSGVPANLSNKPLA